MDTIEIKAEFLLEIKSKRDWINRLPEALPKKKTFSEMFLFVDKNGYVFLTGKDFSVAEQLKSYPCKVYRLINVASLL